MSDLELVTTLSNNDWFLIYSLNQQCFKNDEAIEVLTPKASGAEPTAQEVELFKNACFGGPIERAYSFLKDPRSGRPVSYISARVYRGENGIIDGAFAQEPPPIKLLAIPDTEDREFWEWYWNTSRDCMRRLPKMQASHIYIQVVGTDEVWRGQGAATRLMQWIFDFAQTEKIPRCMLQASPELLRVGWYERLGFQIASRRTMAFKGREGPENILMYKELHN